MSAAGVVAAGAEREDVDLREPNLARDIAGLGEFGVGLAGEANDDVSGDRRAIEGFP